MKVYWEAAKVGGLFSLTGLRSDFAHETDMPPQSLHDRC
jgi:hypothetical protein